MRKPLVGVLGLLTGFILSTLSAMGQFALGLLILSAGLAHAHAHAQSSPGHDPLGGVAVLIGRWSGTTEGQPGKGTVEREYSWLLGSRFIEVKNRSSYPATEKKPKGEIHEDLGIFSFDKARKTIVFRQFHVEGFVNHYVQTADGKAGALTFTSESIENIPSGWRARETYVLTGTDQLEEVFELAAPGKDYELYSRTRLSRVK